MSTAQFWRDLVLAWEPNTQIPALVAVPSRYVNVNERDLRVYSADLLLTFDVTYGIPWVILFGATTVPTPANQAQAAQLLAALAATTPQAYWQSLGIKSVPQPFGWPVAPFGRLLTQAEWGMPLLPGNSACKLDPVNDPNPVVPLEKPLLWPGNAPWPPPGWWPQQNGGMMPYPIDNGQPWPPVRPWPPPGWSY